MIALSALPAYLQTAPVALAEPDNSPAPSALFLSGWFFLFFPLSV